jgi:uncharacterized protein
MRLILVLGVATVCGLAAERLNMPGGLIFGSMIGAAAMTLWRGGGGIAVPHVLEQASFVVIGTAIGTLVTRQSLTSMRSALLPAVLAAALLILAGIAIAYFLRVVGLAPPDDILATSPGALSAVSALAIERGVGPVEVSLFHLIRVVLVILSLPAVSLLLDSSGG